jgi:hypothetical protein
MIVHKRSGHELEDRDHYGEMLETIDKRLRGEQTISGLPSDTTDKTQET